MSREGDPLCKTIPSKNRPWPKVLDSTRPQIARNALAINRLSYHTLFPYTHSNIENRCQQTQSAKNQNLLQLSHTKIPSFRLSPYIQTTQQLSLSTIEAILQVEATLTAL